MPPRRRVRRAVRSASLAMALVTSAAACNAPPTSVGPVPSTSPGARPLALAYLAPAPGDTPAFLPAFRGAEVALEVAALDGVAAMVTWLEVPEDLAGWSLPLAIDAAIVAPGTSPAVVARLGALLDVPTVSLAGGPAGSGWRSLAAGDGAIAAAMLAEGGERPCLVVGADGHDVAATLTAAGTPTAPARLRAGAVLRAPEVVAGCTAVLWPGAGAPGAALRLVLAAAGFGGLPFVATDRLRDGDFEDASGSGRRGVVVTSGAVDVTTRLDLGSRRFVQDYQARVGTSPGPFSVEGWDAAQLLLLVLREGWPDRFAGVGGRYDLATDAPAVLVYRWTRSGWRAR